MVETSDTFGSQDNPIDNTDVGAETVTLDVRVDSSSGVVLYRYVNTTNVAVDVTVEATDSTDKTFDESEELRGSASGTPSTLTVSNGSADSDLITEPWELLRFSITFQSDPTSGQFELRELEDN